MSKEQPKIVRAIGAKPSPEEMEQQAKRAAIQKRNSLAEMILANAIQSSHGTRIDGNGRPDFKPAVLAAIEAADLVMSKLYGMTFSKSENE